jgi:hypothetical protein
MSMRWQDDSYEPDPPRWFVCVGIVLLVTGIGPIMAAQLAWFIVTGHRMEG